MLNGVSTPRHMRWDLAEGDVSNWDPLGGSKERRVSEGFREAHDLPEVVRGRMLCVTHGRMCYRRISRVGAGEWICPDERHLSPIAGS